MVHPYVALTETQENALIGSMLGDGHLRRGKLNVELIIARAIKDQDYLSYEQNIFDNFLPNRFKNNQLRYFENKNPEGINNPGYSFSTITSPTFTPYHSKWYNWETRWNARKKILDEGYVKHIPSDLQLNGQIVAHWLADDAFITFNKLPYRFQIDLATNGFTHQEVIFLAELLSKRYNDEEFMVRKHIKSTTGKISWFIRMYDNAVRAMLPDIDVHFKMDRKRTWDAKEARYYSNTPQRQVSKIKSFALKKKQIEEKIFLGEDFKLMDLAQDIKLCYWSPSSNKTVISYPQINKLFKIYLDSFVISKKYDRYDNNTCWIKVDKDKLEEYKLKQLEIEEKDKIK